MSFHVMYGFLLPWIIAIVHLFRHNKTILFLIAPFSSMLAFTVNEIGVSLGFWSLVSKPPFDGTLAMLPYNLGIYPVLASYMTFFASNISRYSLWLVFGIALLTTFLELLMVVMDRVEYGNGWTIGWTFVSYVIPYYLVYLYYRCLKMLRVI
ncbi:CBO0543 family protein [Sediminibacillus sp. JSM 1682029]|uniref:CBO0543 family protein n=1 Tax=Sediminibacillus sp. JSM 1682029 TaxID=3229857 RepID=UPI00047C3758